MLFYSLGTLRMLSLFFFLNEAIQLFESCHDYLGKNPEFFQLCNDMVLHFYAVFVTTIGQRIFLYTLSHLIPGLQIK